MGTIFTKFVFELVVKPGPTPSNVCGTAYMGGSGRRGSRTLQDDDEKQAKALTQRALRRDVKGATASGVSGIHFLFAPDFRPAGLWRA